MAKSKKLDRKELTIIIEAAIIIAIGVLFCFQISLGKILSMILGIALIVAGLVFMTLSIVNKKSTLTGESILASALVGLGVIFIVNDIVSFVFSLVPYLLITLGSIVFIDAFLGAFLRKEGKWFIFVLKLIVGSGLIALGICLLTIPEFAKYVGIIFGAALIIVGIYLIMIMLLARSANKPAKSK